MVAGEVSLPRGHLRRRTRALGASIAALALLIVSLPVGPASALAPDRQGWWNRLNGPAPAPAPPDVPADGLYVAYSTGVDAIAAVVFSLPPGAPPAKLVLDLAPTSTPLPAIQACLVAPEATDFASVQNGAWSQVPRYDCANAPEASVDANRTAMTFGAPAVAPGGLLAVALVPKGPGRAAFKKPGATALEVGAPGATASSPTGEPTASPASESAPANPQSASASAAGAFVPPPAPDAFDFTGAPAEATAVTDPDIGTEATRTSLLPAVRGGVREAAEGIWGLRKQMGGVIGVGLLVAVLLFYSQGRGPLGGRLDARHLLLRADREERL